MIRTDADSSGLVVIDSFDIRTTPKSVLKRMGRGVSETKWAGAVSRVFEQYWPRIQPRGVFRVTICHPDGDSIGIGKNLGFRSGFLQERLPYPRLSAIFLVTIGAELEEGIREEMRKGRNRRAYILDCLGSNAAEATAAAIHRAVEEQLDVPMSRYSPGYNDWDIAEQRILFDFLGRDTAKEVGVRLTHDFMMTPQKSVSGIILPRMEQNPN